MKRTLFLLGLIVCLQTASAQYSTILSDPLKICLSPASQKNVQAFNKGNNATYTYWLDNRNGKFQVFGQRLDAAGLPQWTPNGKLLAANGADIQAMRVIPWQSGALLAWMTLDTMFCKYINNSGNDMWAQPTVVATTGNGVIYMENSGFNIFANDSGATITHAVIYTGGSDLFTFNRIDFNGNLHWAPLNFTTPLQGYDYRSASDKQNGFFVLSKGNGIGSTMFIQRYDFAGNAMWSSGLDITSGNSTIGFSGNITMEADSNANLFVTWDGNAGSIQVTKVTPAGAFAWSTPRTVPSAATASGPSRCHARLNNGSLYVTWLENVGSNSICKMQRVDGTGTIQWTSGGIDVDTANGYYGYPKLALSDSGAVTVFFQGTPGVALTAQRIRSNGSLTWAPDSRFVSAASGDWVFYADYAPVDDPGGCNVVCWTTFSTADIAAARICSDGVLSGISQPQSGAQMIQVFPNPSTGTIHISGIPAESVSVMIYNVQGGLVRKLSLQQNGTSDVLINDLPSGLFLYCIRDRSDAINASGKLIVY